MVVFALSIIGILLNTKQKSENHNQAFIQLSNLLSESRIIDNIDNDSEKNQRISLFIQKYNHINSIIVPIPNKKFNRLKAEHLRKVEFSKFISEHPCTPFLLQKIKFFFLEKNRKHDQ